MKPFRAGGALAAAAAALVLVPASVRAVRGGGDAPAGVTQVVVFVGDGMGLPHVTLGRLAAERVHRPYAFDRFQVVGLASTCSADSIVTDSAAAATALSSGYRTRNGAIGVDPEGRPRRTLLELARRAGFATGLVTTTRITHATPSAFGAHQVDRNDEARVAEQYLVSGIDVLYGGGQRLLPDDRLEAFRARGYAVVTSAAAFRKLDAATVPRVLGVFAPEHLSYDVDRDPELEPSLRELTESALTLLGRGGRPYFCMIEGGRIDHAAHLHDAAALVRDQLAFADAIDAALERVERGGKLLVLVTADHATGGVAISERLDLDALLRVRTSVERLVRSCPEGELTASPASYRKAMEEHFGFTPTAAELATARRGFGPSAGITPVAHVVSQRFGVGFYDLDFQQVEQPGTHGHEASLVPVFAAGAGAAGFAGVYENVRIPFELARLTGLPAPGGLVADERAKAFR